MINSIWCNFHVKINDIGFCNNFHVAFQIEDTFDILSVMSPNYNPGKRVDRGLNAREMSFRFERSQQKGETQQSTN